MSGSRVSLWAVRVLWAGAAASAAVALDRADHLGHSGALAGAWWGVVGIVTVALVVPGCAALTLTRVAVPAVLPAAVGLLVSLPTAAHSTGSTVAAAVMVVLVAAASAVAMSAAFGEGMVQSSAYGHERRFPLRPPASSAAAIAVTWCVWAAVLTVAVLLVAADRVAAGAVGAVVALTLGAVLWRTYHRFALRWFVLVPAGLVIHDPVVLGETLMVLRPNVLGARLAPADTGAADLTGPAPGFAIEVTVRDAVTALLAADRDHPRGRAIHATAFLVAPSRPGRVLRAVADGRYAVT